MYILVLDDSELNNVLMSEALRDIPGCRVICFTEPLKALDFARDKQAELGTAVIDYEMPGMDGIAFIQAARAVPGLAHLPIVMVTSLDQRRVRRDALSAGATDFMVKPCPVEALVEVPGVPADEPAVAGEQTLQRIPLGGGDCVSGDRGGGGAEKAGAGDGSRDQKGATRKIHKPRS